MPELLGFQASLRIYSIHLFRDLPWIISIGLRHRLCDPSISQQAHAYTPLESRLYAMPQSDIGVMSLVYRFYRKSIAYVD
jgi:hypothetical protein